LEVESKAPAPLLLGRHLLEMGLAPGPRIGEITRAVYEMQLDGRIGTLDEAIEVAKEMMSTDYAEVKKLGARLSEAVRSFSHRDLCPGKRESDSDDEGFP
jgi:hypothetical protein